MMACELWPWIQECRFLLDCDVHLIDYTKFNHFHMFWPYSSAFRYDNGQSLQGGGSHTTRAISTGSRNCLEQVRSLSGRHVTGASLSNRVYTCHTWSRVQDNCWASCRFWQDWLFVHSNQSFKAWWWKWHWGNTTAAQGLVTRLIYNRTKLQRAEKRKNPPEVAADDSADNSKKLTPKSAGEKSASAETCKLGLLIFFYRWY